MAEMSRTEKWIVNRVNPWTYQHVLRPFFQHHLRLPANAALLEVGCGTGQAALITNQLYHPAKFVVTDYDPSQVAEARATFQGAYGQIPSQITVETADALQFRYADASFDALFAFFVLHHLSEHKLGKVQAAMVQGLAEIDRVIKPGGSFIYSDMFQRKTIRDYFTCKGYEIVHRQNFLAVIELVIIRKQSSAAPAIVELSTASTLPATTG